MQSSAMPPLQPLTPRFAVLQEDLFTGGGGSRIGTTCTVTFAEPRGGKVPSDGSMKTSRQVLGPAADGCGQQKVAGKRESLYNSIAIASDFVPT
mmetsp:Transcript_49303/g.95308  ORF Transcript_49303/g.95308 Transcript_49303/m.95308 type:complete len:94 (-) Transcript_49303:221-502(-)